MQSTPSYLWSTEDCLGQGATASVYKARNKVGRDGRKGRTRNRSGPSPHPSCPVVRVPLLPLLTPGSSRGCFGAEFRFSFGSFPPRGSSSGQWVQSSFGVLRSRSLSRHSRASQGEEAGFGGMPGGSESPVLAHLHVSCKHSPGLHPRPLMFIEQAPAQWGGRGSVEEGLNPALPHCALPASAPAINLMWS